MPLNRRRFLWQTGWLAGVSVLPWQQALLGLVAGTVGEMRSLRGNVGIFTGRGGSIAWLIEENGLVVVDTQFPPQAEELIAKIRNKTDRKFDLLINTHHHGDHSSGNIAFEGLTDKVVAHNNSCINQMNSAEQRGNEDKQLYPDTTFEDQMSFEVGQERVTLQYFGAAHTNGDALIHFENANVVHMGDLMFNRRYPFIDRSAGASIQNWIEVLRKTLDHFDDDTLFVFGHSGNGYDVVGEKADLRAMQNYLQRLLETVRRAMQAGKSEAEILTIRTIEGAPDFKGKGIARSLRAAYAELME